MCVRFSFENWKCFNECYQKVIHEIDLGRAYGSLKCVPVDFVCTNSRKILVADTLHDSIKVFELKQ